MGDTDILATFHFQTFIKMTMRYKLLLQTEVVQQLLYINGTCAKHVTAVLSLEAK